MTKQRLTPAEQDLLTAIDRIAVGQPRDRQNKKLHSTGKLRLTPTTVAREAKRSRQSIYRSERVRQALNVNRRLHSQNNTLSDIVREAREDRRTIAEENTILASNLARAVNAAGELQEELQELRTRFDRRSQRLRDAESRLQVLLAENQELRSKNAMAQQLNESN